MQSRSSALVVAAALIATWAICFGPDSRQSIAASDAPKIAVAPEPEPAALSLDTTQVVPADVLGTGVVSWVPLSGDGSN